MSNTIIHKRSSVVTDGKPKLPSLSGITYGELAINYADGVETLAIKNSNNEIVEFKSKEYFENIIVENEEITAGALTDLDKRLKDVEEIIENEINEINEISNELNAHTTNTDIHITSDERTKWDDITGKTNNTDFINHTGKTGSTSELGHVKIVTGDVNTVTAVVDGEAAASFHNHDTRYCTKEYLDNALKEDEFVISQAISDLNLKVKVINNELEKPIDTVSGDVSTIDNFTIGLPSASYHNHDGKYYTKDEINSIIKEDELTLSIALGKINEEIKNVGELSTKVETIENLINIDSVETIDNLNEVIKYFEGVSETETGVQLLQDVAELKNHNHDDTYAPKNHTHISSDITDSVSEINDSVSASTALVQAKAVYDLMSENEEIVATALTNLDERVNEGLTLINEINEDLSSINEDLGKCLKTTGGTITGDLNILNNVEIEGVLLSYGGIESNDYIDAPRIKENGTSLSNKYAPKNHTHISSDITDSVSAITSGNSASTSLVQTKAVCNLIKENEEIVAQSLTDLDERTTDLSETLTTLNTDVTEHITKKGYTDSLGHVYLKAGNLSGVTVFTTGEAAASFHNHHGVHVSVQNGYANDLSLYGEPYVEGELVIDGELKFWDNATQQKYEKYATKTELEENEYAVSAAITDLNSKLSNNFSVVKRIFNSADEWSNKRIDFMIKNNSNIPSDKTWDMSNVPGKVQLDFVLNVRDGALFTYYYTPNEKLNGVDHYLTITSDKAINQAGCRFYVGKSDELLVKLKYYEMTSIYSGNTSSNSFANGTSVNEKMMMYRATLSDSNNMRFAYLPIRLPVITADFDGLTGSSLGLIKFKIRYTEPGALNYCTYNESNNVCATGPAILEITQVI